jgi:FkbH-like protein
MSEAPRIALFTDSAPQFLERELNFLAKGNGGLEMKTYAFTSPLAVLEELAVFAPNAIIVWQCAEAMGEKDTVFPEALLTLPYTILACTMVSRDDGTCGSGALTWKPSLRRRILSWNAHLIELAETHANLHIIDLDAIQSRLGREVSFDARLWEAASIALTPKAIQSFGRAIWQTLTALKGQVKKVLVTDLDNTFWGGITGEQGADAVNPDAPGHAAYRAWVKQLSSRGILLAIASHNDRPAVEALFAQHPLGMALKDFQCCEINWDPKPQMLTRIATTLNVGTDALVFIDDRKEQRDQVRAALPEVSVPEMPADPAMWMEFLAAENLFETPRITADDTLRVQSFREASQRDTIAKTLSREDYVASLEQELIAEPLNETNLERAAQLTQRCNRFNMRGTRHTTASLMGRTGWVYRLRDRFGDMGIISAVVLEDEIIETWVMSCRVFNRDVEKLILEHLKSVTTQLRGIYEPTERNATCAEVYAKYGVLPPAPTL